MQITLFQAGRIFFNRIYVKRAETSNQTDPGGVKPFTLSDEQIPSGKRRCLFHLINILPFVLSEEQSQGAIASQALSQVYSQGNETEPD